MYIVACDSVHGGGRKPENIDARPLTRDRASGRTVSGSTGSGAAVTERPGAELVHRVVIAGAAHDDVRDRAVEVGHAADPGRGGVVRGDAVAHLGARLVRRRGHLTEDL